MILYWFVVCVVFLSEIYVLHTYLLLPVFGEIFEKLIFNSYFEYLDEQQLLSEHQSSFRPNDSCTNQLFLAYTAFDADSTLEVWGVFLDLSKAFDRIWY